MTINLSTTIVFQKGKYIVSALIVDYSIFPTRKADLLQLQLPTKQRLCCCSSLNTDT